MSKEPQTIKDLLEFIKDKNFKPTCEEFSKLLDKVIENEINNDERIRLDKPKQKGKR